MGKTCKLVLYILILSSSALADELKILDGLGLTRAVRNVTQPRQVIIRIKSGDNLPKALVLTNVDGFSPNISASSVKAETYEFNSVGIGTWRIVAPKGVQIIAVSINPDN